MASILVIEDEARTARSIMDELASAGHKVNWAASGKAGLAHAQTGPVDLVTLDRLLPDIDGLEVCRRIRALPAPASSVPVSWRTVRWSSVSSDGASAITLSAGSNARPL